MIFVKPWRLEAVARLVLSVFVCVCSGSVAGCILHFWQFGGKTTAGVFYPLAALGVAFLAGSLALLRRPLRPENLTTRLVLIFGCVYAGMLTQFCLHNYSPTDEPSVAQTILGTFCAYGGGLFIMGCFVREHGMDWTEAFGLDRHPSEAVAFGLVAAACFLPVGWTLQQIVASVLTHFAPVSMKPEEQHVVHMLRSVASWSERSAMGVITILVAPFAEEVFFRGVLFTVVRQAGFPRAALWGTSVLFALVHLNLLTFLPLLALALLLAFLYQRTNNLLAPIAAHSLFNGVNFLMLYLQGDS